MLQINLRHVIPASTWANVSSLFTQMIWFSGFISTKIMGLGQLFCPDNELNVSTSDLRSWISNLLLGPIKLNDLILWKIAGSPCTKAPSLPNKTISSFILSDRFWQHESICRRTPPLLPQALISANWFGNRQIVNGVRSIKLRHTGR